MRKKRSNPFVPHFVLFPSLRRDRLVVIHTSSSLTLFIPRFPTAITSRRIAFLPMSIPPFPSTPTFQIFSLPTSPQFLQRQYLSGEVLILPYQYLSQLLPLQQSMDTIRVVTRDDPTPITVPEEAVSFMETLKSASVISSGDIPIDVSKAVFEKILEFLKLNNFQAIKTANVTSNDLSKALEGDKTNFDFLDSFKNSEGLLYSRELAELFRAASVLQCKSLQQLIGLKIATLIYFEDSSESYNTTKNNLGIKSDITVEDEERYAKLYR